MALDLAIVTPDQEASSIRCDEVVVPGVNGEMGLLPGHIPLITALRPGVLTVLTQGKKTHYAVSTGYAEIGEDKVTVLTDACEEASTIDVERAKRALESAEAALAKAGDEQSGWTEQQRRLLKAQARLDAATRRS